jgi:hypothetical protein
MALTPEQMKAARQRLARDGKARAAQSLADGKPELAAKQEFWSDHDLRTSQTYGV